MKNSQLLDPVQILYGPGKFTENDSILIIDNKIKAFGQEARDIATNAEIEKTSATKKVIAPCLVDPHSILEDPLNGCIETLASLKNRAAKAGYGQVALLPRSLSWRDRPESLLGLSDTNKNNVSIHLWGSFSVQGKGETLSSHANLLSHGAIGLAEDDYILPIELIKKGLLLGEMKSYPVLISPRDASIQGNGYVREGVEALRAGWNPDPEASETIPLGIILELQRQHPTRNIRVMNISTATGVSMLAQSSIKPMASVCWWHLLADTSLLSPTDVGWRVIPSIGNANDRSMLIEGLSEGIISAVAVHGVPLDEAETKKPLEQRKAGISGHHLVLPSLWQELIVKRNWKVEELWEKISFGPSKILNSPLEQLTIGSNRWLLFDPQIHWVQALEKGSWPSSSNQPWIGKKLQGKVVDCGLID